MSGKPSSSPPPAAAAAGPIYTPPPRNGSSGGGAVPPIAVAVAATPSPSPSPTLHLSSPVPSAASSSSAAAAAANLSNLATFAALANSHAHYGTDLWDAIPAVADQSESAKGYLVRLSKFLKDKAELDKEYARGLKKLVLKLQVPDVPRVNEIPTPPAAAAQVAQAVVAAAAGGSASSGTSLGSTLAASGQLSTAASPSKDGASSTSTGSSVPPSPSAPAVVDPRSFDRFMMAFRNLHMTLATNFEILSAKIVEQVYKPLSVHREAHASASKRLLADLDKYTVSYQRHLDGLLQSRAACQKACQESDAMRRKLEHASTHASATTNPHALNDLLASFKADSASLAKRALQADAKYIQHVKSMRGFRQSSDATLAHVLDQFESLEVSKLGTCKETLGHYLAIQNQMFASNLKNLTAVQSVLDKVNVHTDMQYFILLNKSGKLPIALPEYQVFRGHPNYTMPGAAGGEESEGGHQLDMSSYSSAQMGEGMNDSPSDLVGAGIGAGAGGIGGGINSGFAASGGVTSVPGTAGGLLASAKSASSKGSGWGWLNSIASVLPGTQQNKTHRGLGIDHDSEAMLTRGSNYYEQKAAAAAAAATGTDDADDPDSSPPASRRGTTSASGGDEGDDAEEKTPERLAAEKQLSEYFDAITGRAPSGSTPTSSASGSGAPSKSLSPSLSGAHESVTYSTSRERDLTPEELARTDALLATVEGRKAFASVLNRQRNTSGGLRLSSSSSLHRLAEWCRRFLDAAQQSMHVNPTQLVMIMSQSFYVEELAPPASASASSSDSSFAGASDATDEDSHAASARLTRIYLISLIKDHALWKQLRFWEEAFFDAFNTKIRKSAAAKVHKWHSDMEQAESLHTRKQVCFSTLSTFAHNLLDFGLPVRTIIDFVEKLASINELEPEQMAMLRSMEVYHSDSVVAEEEQRKQEEERRDQEAHRIAAAALAHAQDPNNLIGDEAEAEGEAGGEQFEQVEREDNLP